MLRVNSKLKYIFDNVPVMEVSENGFTARVDKAVYVTFKGNDLKGIQNDEDWDLVHLDGDLENCALDNLELVVFENEKSLKPISELEEAIKDLKKELVLKNEQIKKLTSDCIIKDAKVSNMQKQMVYEQNKVKELNKELRAQESEIRRLLSLITDNTRR